MVKEKVKLFLFTGDIMLDIENSKDSTKIARTNKFSKVAVCKNQYSKIKSFSTPQ